jgi:uncharacterized membrane protein
MSILKRGLFFGALVGIGGAAFLWKRKGHQRTPVIAAVTINRPVVEVFQFFRHFDRLPQFMTYLESVELLDDTRSRWTAKLPFGATVQWTAEITEDRPDEVIAWQSTEDSALDVRGRVTFTKTVGRDMTEVRAEMELGARGHASSALARLFARPQVRGDLQRLKQVLETGEVLYSDASAHRGPHPAQPSADRDVKASIFIPHPPTAAKGVTP